METKKRIVIAGGTGFLGLNLACYLTELDFDVVLLGRHAPNKQGPWRHAGWDGRSVGSWVSELDGAAAIVNLAGRTVDCIKTPDHCDEILRSRVEATSVLGLAVREVESPPPVWVQMSTAHQFCDRTRRRCLTAVGEAGSLGTGGHGRQWQTGDELDSCTGYESIVLPGDHRRNDAGGLSGDGSGTGFECRFHARITAGAQDADRVTSGKLDGADWCAAVDADGPGAGAVWSLLCLQSIAGRGVWVFVSRSDVCAARSLRTTNAVDEIWFS